MVRECYGLDEGASEINRDVGVSGTQHIHISTPIFRANLALMRVVGNHAFTHKGFWFEKEHQIAVNSVWWGK